MPAKRMGCLGKVLAVLFTGVVAPVLTNLLTQEATNWSQGIHRAVESALSPAAKDWNRPVVEGVPPAPAAVIGRPYAQPAPQHWRLGQWGR